MSDTHDLRPFFERYAHASRRAEPEALAALYAPVFIVGGPQGSHSFANDAKFLDWLRQVHAFNEQHGLLSLAVRDVGATVLSPLHTLATVRWGSRFARTGDRLIEFTIAYLLERAGDGWKVLAYISEEDQEAAMKKHGLL